MLHFSLPSTGLALAGSENTGPTPHTNLPGLAGEKNADETMSLTANAAACPDASGGWLRNGMIQRGMRFQSSFSENGTTGWKFITKRVSSSGPTGAS